MDQEPEAEGMISEGGPAETATPDTEDVEKDPGVKQLDQAQTDEERAQLEAELLVQTDNRARPEDGTQPAQDPEEET
jgi:hypothetical protein